MLALVSHLNADLLPLLPIQAPLRARGIRHPYLLLPARPRCLPLPVQADILRVLEREGVTARVVTFRVFTLAVMARYTKIVPDHLLPVQKLWKRIVSLPFLHYRRTCPIIVPLHSLHTTLPFPSGVDDREVDCTVLSVSEPPTPPMLIIFTSP